MATLVTTYNTRRVASQTATWEASPTTPRPIKGAGSAGKSAQSGSLAYQRTLLAAADVGHLFLSWGLMAVTGFFLLFFATQFLNSPVWEKTRWVVLVRTLGDPIIVQLLVEIKGVWPTFRFAGYLPLVLALVVSGVKVGAGAVIVPALGQLRKRVFELEPKPLARAATVRSDESKRVDSEQDRDVLLKRYREIESALRDTEHKLCTFLSIDVVGSTKMKENERELPVTITFQAYMKMLEDIFEKHSAWKQSWTPDGVMVCFLDLESAVAAGQEVLRRLRVFNRTENLLRSRISVRCGLNEGEMTIFEDSKLEKIAHRVIDITGHMQKHAKPDTLWVAAEVQDKLADSSGFKPTGKQVDGHHAYEWSPSLALPDSPPVYVTAPQSGGNTEATWA